MDIIQYAESLLLDKLYDQQHYYGNSSYPDMPELQSEIVPNNDEIPQIEKMGDEIDGISETVTEKENQGKTEKYIGEETA
mgnify:CR=1